MSRFLDWIESRQLAHKLPLLLLLVVAAVVASLLIGTCARRPSSVIPPELQARVTKHDEALPAAQARIDSALRFAEQQQTRADQAIAAAHVAQARADQQGHTADSLAQLAATARTAADSAQEYHAAYDARTAEVASLHTVIQQDTAAMLGLRQRGDSLQRALIYTDSMRHEADSLLHAVVRVAKTQGCAVPGTFGLVGCPSRKVTFVAGVVAAVGGVAVWTHRDQLGFSLLSLHR